MANRLIKAGGAALLGTLGTGQALAAAPFVVNSDGTVTDTSTGLMWDQCSWGQNNTSGTCLGGAASTHNWTAALSVAASASGSAWKGYSDWRLPNIDELRSLVKTGSSPTIDTAVFPNTPAPIFWSASSLSNSSNSAWSITFSTGGGLFSLKDQGYQVRLVRSGQFFGAFGLTPIGVSGLTVHSAMLTASSAIAATGYWLVLPRNATAPSAAQVIAGGASYVAAGVTITVAASGNAPMTAKTPASFTISSLTVSTAFDLYLVAQESTALTTSSVAGPIQFSTLGIATRAIVIDPTTPAKLYAALDGAGVYASSDSSATWTPIITGLSNLNVRDLVMQDSNTLFAATYDGGVFKGSLSGSPATWSWATCDTGSSLSASTRLRSIALDASGNLYAGSETGVYKGSTACGAWTASSAGLP